MCVDMGGGGHTFWKGGSQGGSRKGGSQGVRRGFTGGSQGVHRGFMKGEVHKRGFTCPPGYGPAKTGINVKNGIVQLAFVFRRSAFVTSIRRMIPSSIRRSLCLRILYKRVACYP